MVPGAVTTLEALLGHITEHLLQLLGVAEKQKGGGGWEDGGSEGAPRGFLLGQSQSQSKGVREGPYVLPYVCVLGTRAGDLGGQMSPGE